MPNIFPEGDIQPYYNTVDASLLFISSVDRPYLSPITSRRKMDDILHLTGLKNAGRILNEEVYDYGKLAEKVRQSFLGQFWNEKEECLKDVVSGTKATVFFASSLNPCTFKYAR